MVATLPIASGATDRARSTNGTWMRASSGSTADNSGSGGRLTRTAMCLIFSFSHSGTAKAARRFLARPIERFDEPRVVITDKLGSYLKPICDLAPGADHRAHKGLNNRIKGSNRPTRKREKLMGRFKSPGQAQRFLAAHDQINTIFRPRRYRLTAKSYRHARADALDLWSAYTLAMTA